MVRDFVYVEELEAHVGERVILKGWLYHKRSGAEPRKDADLADGLGAFA